DELGVGGTSHYAQSDEDKNKDDGSVFEGLLYAKYLDTKLTLGYVKSGKEIGWGSLNTAGDQIVQFEEGDVMYERDAKTFYAMLSTSCKTLFKIKQFFA
ncbi:MAG: porin, partial [Campylobacter hyointestinalis]